MNYTWTEKVWMKFQEPPYPSPLKKIKEVESKKDHHHFFLNNFMPETQKLYSEGLRNRLKEK